MTCDCHINGCSGYPCISSLPVEVSIEAPPEPIAAWLPYKLTGWANQMWMRFGGEGVAVYLVGSSLTSTSPRDVDVSIVMEPHLFALRYGGIEGDWPSQWSGMEWPSGMKKWAKESGGLVPGLCRALTSCFPPDLKVMTTYEQFRNHEGPRLRLDTISDYEPEKVEDFPINPETRYPKAASP